jgi:hypothetical protein
MDAMRPHSSRLIAAAMWLVACQTSDLPIPPSVQFWLDCEECAGQLDTLKVIGQPAVPVLSEVLRNGPPASRINRLEKYLDSLHGALARHVHTHPNDGPLPGKRQYIDSYVGAFSDRYRLRAAVGLATIGGPEARAALDSALADSSRPRVWATVRLALDSICGLKPDPGECR